MEAIIRVGGAAGTGVASVGSMIAKLCSRSGLNVRTYNYYQSVIRGGHNAYQIWVSDEEFNSPGDGVDYILALDKLAAEVQIHNLNNGGQLIFDIDTIQVDSENLPPGADLLPIPLISLARKAGRETRMKNTTGVGVIAGLLGLDKELLKEIHHEIFASKSLQIAQSNTAAAFAGYDYVQNKHPELGKEFRQSGNRQILITGNEAIALGAIAAGCRFYCAYPMTPASSILHTMAAQAKKHDIVVKQAEDEIAVINMTVGAGAAGARAMCGTSGGGFALMTEAVGLAGMTETSIVVVESARGGPSTGLPTRTEQGDLNQMLGASQGDFPKIILAPGNAEEAFYTTVEAFNLADRYQCPVIISLDLALSESPESVESLDAQVPINRPVRATWKEGETYKRFVFTENGISPVAFPGDPGTMFVASSDEHDEDGIILSDVRAGLPDMIKTRRKMMEKRMKKLETALSDMPPPTLEGPNEAQITLIGYGSTKNNIKGARRILEKGGIATNHLHLKYLMPFHADEVRSILENCSTCLIIEGNYTGQLERLIKAETGVSREFYNFRKYDGEPILPGEIVEKVKEVL